MSELNMETISDASKGIGTRVEGALSDSGETEKPFNQDPSPEIVVQETSLKAEDKLVAPDFSAEDQNTGVNDSDAKNGLKEDENHDGTVCTNCPGQKEHVGNLPDHTETFDPESQIVQLTKSGHIVESDGTGNDKSETETALADDNGNESLPTKMPDETVKESDKIQKRSAVDAWSFSDNEDTVTVPVTDNVKGSREKQQQGTDAFCEIGKENTEASPSLKNGDKSHEKREKGNDKTVGSDSADDNDKTPNYQKLETKEESIKRSQSLSVPTKSPFRIELRFRLVKTAALVTTWICIGLFTELTGPTFKDLEIRLHLPEKEATEAVSRATSGRSIGFFAGAVIGGFLVDRFKRKGDLFIGLALVCAAGVTIAVPWMSTFITMWFLMFCQGTFEGIINVAGQEIILLLWGEKSAGPMHLLHFGFGIGSFLNPLIAQPFLGITVEHYANSTLEAGSLAPGHNNTNATVIETIENSRIEYAYLIASIATAAFSSTFFWYQFRGVPEGGYVEDDKIKEEVSTKTGAKQYLKLIDPASCADGRRLAGLTMFILLFMYFFQAVGGERIYSKFIRNFALDNKELGFSSSEATYLNSSFWISFSIGRFLGFIVAIWVPIKILILVECFSALGFAALLTIFGRSNKLAVWVITQPMALFLAPLFPSGVAWSDHYLKMSGLGIMILIAGGSLGGVVYIWILGYIYPNYGPNTFLYMVLTYGIAAAAFSCLLSFAGYINGDRFQRMRMEEEILSEDDKHESITYTNDLKMDTL